MESNRSEPLRELVDELSDFVRQNVDEFAPIIKKYPVNVPRSHRVLESDDLNEFYIFLDLLHVYWRIIKHDAKSDEEMFGWQALLDLARAYGLDQSIVDWLVEAAIEAAVTDEPYRCQWALKAYDDAEGTDYVSQYRLFLVKFAGKAAKLDGISKAEELEQVGVSLNLDGTIETTRQLRFIPAHPDRDATTDSAPSPPPPAPLETTDTH